MALTKLRSLVLSCYAQGILGERFVYLPTWWNAVQCLAHPTKWREDNAAHRLFQKRLQQLRITELGSYYDAQPIPRIIHFVHLYPPGDLSLASLVAIRTAMLTNPGWKVVLHCYQPPVGQYAQQIRDDVIFNHVKGFTYFGNASILHPAHKADIVRLLALHELGGLYLDLDTICVKTFDELRAFPFVIGVQAAIAGEKARICNATMLASPGSKFGRLWLRSYRFFRSRGRDHLWDLHSGKLTAKRASVNPSLVRVLNHDAFFFPLWNDAERMLLAENSERFWPFLDSSYSFHLWSQFTGPFLDQIDINWIQTSRSNYARMARNALDLTVEYSN
jgi:hypothetical protein